MGPPDSAAGPRGPATLAAAGDAAVATARALAAVAVVVAATAATTAPAVAAAAGAGVAGDCGDAPGERALVVENASTGDRLLAVPASNGTRVALAYTHSVEKTRVVDGYRVRGDRLVMTRMEFESFGAGLPSRAEVNRTANGSFVFDPPGAYEQLYVTPGRIAGHELAVGDRRFDLVALSNASTVRFHVVACAPDADVGADR